MYDCTIRAWRWEKWDPLWSGVVDVFDLGYGGIEFGLAFGAKCASYLMTIL